MGVIDVLNPTIGIIDTNIKNKIYCTENAIWKDIKNIRPSNTCTSYINKVTFYERIIQ